MYQIPTCTLFLVLFFSSLVTAANFTHCLLDFKNDPNATGGVDSQGRPTTPAQAVGLTYETCTARCGGNADSLNWGEFAHSWLPPWLALISQLPYGSGNNVDDFASVVISLGSPALAAYSLALTTLNTRLVYRRAQRIEHESGNAVARTLVSLQQIPPKLPRDKHLPAFSSIHDWLREVAAGHLNRRHVWPIAIGSSVTWVTIAFVFTLVNSFVSLDASPDGGSEGLAVGFLWLWFLCLVVGWLWVPAFTCKPMERKVQVEETQEDTKPIGREYESRSDSFPNPAHRQSIAPFQSSSEIQLDHTHACVSANQITNHSDTTLSLLTTINHIIHKNSNHPTVDWPPINISNGSGLLKPDEHRLAATFNYSKVMDYLALVHDVFQELENSIVGNAEQKSPTPDGTAQCTGNAVFPLGALTSMFNASIVALVLQCGTTAAAVIIVVLTPTIGLGCRSLGYIIYGGVAILILFLTIVSTLSARISETRVGRSTTFSIKSFAAFTAIALRILSLFLAFANVTWLIVLSSFQFSHFFDNCYCNASVIGRGTDSHIIISFQEWIPTMKAARISATVIAAASMAIYMSFIRFMGALPRAIGHL